MPNLNLLTLLSRSRATSLTSNSPSSSSSTAAEGSDARHEQRPRASQSDNALPRSSLSVSSPSPLERRIHPNLNALAAELSNSPSPSPSRPTDTQLHELSESTTSRAPSSDVNIPFVSLTPWLRSRRHSTGGAATLTAPSPSLPTTNSTTLTTTSTNTNENVDTKTDNSSNSNENPQSENPLLKSRSSTPSTADPEGFETAEDSSPEHDPQDNSYSSSASPAPSSTHRPESSRANRLLTRLTNIGLRSSPTPQSQPPSAWNTFGRRKTRRVNSVPHISDFGAQAASGPSSQHSRESSRNPLSRHEGDVSGSTTHSASVSDSNSFSYSQSHSHSIQDSCSAPYSVPQSPQSPQSSQAPSLSPSRSHTQSRPASYVAMTPPPPLSRQQQLSSSSGFTFGSMGSGPKSRDLPSSSPPPPTSVLRLSLFGGRRQASASTGTDDQERETEKSYSINEQSVGAGAAAGGEAHARPFQFNIDSLVLPHPRTSTSMPSMSDHRSFGDDNQKRDGVITSGTGSSSSRPRAQDIFNTLSSSLEEQQFWTGSRRSRRDTSRSSGDRTKRGSRAIPARPALAGAFEIGSSGGTGGHGAPAPGSPAGFSIFGNLARADNVQAAVLSSEGPSSASLSEQGPSLGTGSIDIQPTRNLSAAGDTLGVAPSFTENNIDINNTNTNTIPPAPSSTKATQDRETDTDIGHQQQDDMVTEVASMSVSSNAKGKGKARAPGFHSPSPSSRKSSAHSSPNVSSPLAGSGGIPLPSVSPPTTPIRSAIATRSNLGAHLTGSPRMSPLLVAREVNVSKGKRKADEAEVDSGVGVGAGVGGESSGSGRNVGEVKKQYRATFAADPRPYRSSSASQNSYRAPPHYRKRARISSASSAPTAAGSDERPSSRSQHHRPQSPSRSSSNRIPSGNQSSRTPSTSSHHHPPHRRASASASTSTSQPHRYTTVSHPLDLQPHYQHASRSKERVESISRQSQVSIPISAIVTPHAPSISISQHQSTMTGRGPGYHMRDPRKPPRVQDTAWSLAFPERGFFEARYGDAFTLSGVVERLSGMFSRGSKGADEGGEGAGGARGENQDPERGEGGGDKRERDIDEDERATRRSSVRWTESGGSPLHAWLFFLGFVVFPVWWIAGFLVRVPKTRRLGGGGDGDGEKGVLLDDPQLEHDAKSWRMRCRVMAGVSLVTYIPFIVLVAVFVPRMK